MEDLGSDYLILLIILTRSNTSIYIYTFTDSGASAISFIDIKFAAKNSFSI